MIHLDALKSRPLHQKLQLPTVLLLLIVYGILAYFTSRADFYALFSLVTFSFVLTYVLLEKTSISIKKLFVLSVLFRVVFIASIPFLSQDFFRFIWDGQLVVNGMNPYANTVDFYFDTNQTQIIENAKLLKDGMGDLNAGNYSNYPPLSQFIYAVCAFLSRGSIVGFIICLRLILIAFDVVFVVFARKLLKLLDKNEKLLFWYVLNPLCILEITGNLHLEGVMIALFVASVYVLVKYKIILSSVLLSLSVSAKLLSLVFFPFMLKHIYSNFKSKPKQSLLIYAAGFTISLVLQFLIFFDPVRSTNFLSSVSLWFTSFEFNASVYYVFRWIGYQIVGWNIIKIYGLLFPIAFILIYGILLFRTKTTVQSLFAVFLMVLTVYFLLSTTIHPWYVLFPLALGVFANYKFPIVWSFVVFLSYYTYRDGNVQENMGLLGLEYGILFLAIGYEIYTKKLNVFRKKSVT
jgi:hypothetical protein